MDVEIITIAEESELLQLARATAANAASSNILATRTITRG